MKVVLDTNVLLIAIPSKSKYRPIFNALLEQKLHLYISNEILLEYAEIIEEKTNSLVSNNVCELLLTLNNVSLIEPFYKWDLIYQDPEDNKFVDCAISGNVDFVVTNDKHFDILKTVEFPKVEIITVEKFLTVLNKLST